MSGDPLDVRCPACGARSGESCGAIVVGGDPRRTLVHRARALEVITLATEDAPGPDGSVDVPLELEDES